MWIERSLTPALKNALKERPAILITGARQTGKTSLCRHFFSGYQFVSLDLPRLAEEAEQSGESFLESHPSPLIIDEVQYAPKLFRYLKKAIEDRRNERGLYVLTGSQKFSLMANVSESLAGRIAVLNLYSLSIAELEKAAGKKAEGGQLLTWMFQGGYPEIHAQQLDVERFYSDYLATYLERDVRQALQVKNLRDFNRFMRLAASRTGQLLSLNTFASDIGASPNTIKSWLSVLEASQIIYILEPYYENLGKRLVKTPKLYFLDTGLACFLTGFRSPEDLAKSTMIGALFETLVLGQIIRWFANRGMEERVYFYRDHQGAEVDFVIPVGKQLKLYECKYSEDPGPVKAFGQMENLFGKKRILSKSIITPVRSHRETKDGTLIENCSELKSLGE
jgi:predicted AAA+ superfamily ATPase